MTTLVIGPLAFGGDGLALLVALAFLLSCGSLMAYLVDDRLGTWAMAIVPVGLLAARLGHVVLHPSGYVSDPARILRLADGGLVAWLVPLAAIPFTFAYLKGWKLRRWSLGVLVATALVWSVAWQLVTATTAMASPEMSFATLNGQPRTIAAFRGKPVVLNLWATWCPPCRREMPMLVEAAAERADVTFVFANQGEGAGTVVGYLAKAGLDIPNLLLDQGIDLARHYSVQGYPATLFLYADGTLRTSHFGEISREALDAKIGVVAPVR